MTFPPIGFDDIVETYGDPRPFIDAPIAWESRILANVVTPLGLFDFKGHPVRSVRCHYKAASRFASVIDDLYGRGLSGIEYGGTYAFRLKRVNSEISTHTFGIAIDLNPTACALGTDPVRQDPRIVEAFDAAGFTWGGRFTGTKDPMHFQLAAGF